MTILRIQKKINKRFSPAKLELRKEKINRRILYGSAKVAPIIPLKELELAVYGDFKQ